MSAFGIFHKNKRQFAHRRKRNLFVAAFLFVLSSTVVTNFILNVRAENEPVPSVTITSSQSDFETSTPGAWQVTKSAEWTGTGKARIIFDVDSVAKDEDSPIYDVLFVIDNSRSMQGSRLTQVKSDTVDLIDTLTRDPNNRIAIVTFNSNATIQSNFTNDKTTLINKVNNISVGSGTNYYQGLLKAEEILSYYSQQDGRDLLLLFLTDGYPNHDIQNGVAEYAILKAQFPKMKITGIQYEMGNTIHQQIIDISDNQYFANIDTLHDVLFDATIGPNIYDNFVITDYIDSDYWEIANGYAISATIGTTRIENQYTEPAVIWDMSGIYHTGQKARMTIDISLKSSIDPLDAMLPTNTHETVVSSVHGNPSENITSPLTPVLSDSYNVTYSANAPSGCSPSGTIPTAEEHTANASVEQSRNILVCDDYIFKGWQSADINGSDYINDDYFRMPSHDVAFKAVWSKPDIAKSLDGTIASAPGATFDVGETVNLKMKALAGSDHEYTSDSDYNVTTFLRAAALPTGFNTNNPDNIISSADSDYPIYAWYSNNAINFYTEATDIYLNPNSSYFFSDFRNLVNVPVLSTFKTNKVTDLSFFFYETDSLASSAPLSTWDTSNVETLEFTFGGTAFTDLSGLANWDTSKVTILTSAFSYNPHLTNLDGIANWDVSHVTTMDFMFSDTSALTDISGLENWNVSNVENMSFLFDRSAIPNIDALYKWNISNVTDMGYMLSHNEYLTNIDGAGGCHTVSGVKQCEDHGWDTSKVTDMSGLFADDIALVNLDGALNWDVSHVTNMTYMFDGATSLTNIDATINWRPSSVTSMYHMFFNATSLENIDGAINWTTGNVTNMSSMFNTALALTNIDGAANWDTSHVTNMSYMFTSTPALTDLSGAENWNVSSVTDTQWMFYQATGITNIDAFHNWQTTSLTNMNSMFNTATSLQNVDGALNWNTSNVTNMVRVFNSATSLTDISGLANWNVGNVTDFTSFFTYDAALSNLSPISGWRPANALNMTWMFAYMTSLSDVSPLQNWRVTRVTDVSSIFLNDRLITTASSLNNWGVPNSANKADAFTGTSITKNKDKPSWAR